MPHLFFFVADKHPLPSAGSTQMYNGNHQAYYQTATSLMWTSGGNYIMHSGEVSTPEIAMLQTVPDGEQALSLMAERATDDSMDGEIISVSTSFTPGNDPEADTILGASDNVYFHISQKRVLDTAPNAFHTYFPALISHGSSVILLDVPSTELNIILHALYKTSPAANNPSFASLICAIDRMPMYGISPAHVITPETPIYELLLSNAPLYPLETYALAGHHGIARLATTVSSHLLSYNINTMSDETAEKMGPVYLRKLITLHIARFQALRSILLRTPMPHAETNNCSFVDQRKVTRAWALAAASLVWEASPDISTRRLSESLNPLLEDLTCKLCERYMGSKIKDVMVQWTAVKHTI